MDAMLENIVYNELKNRDYEVFDRQSVWRVSDNYGQLSEKCDKFLDGE